MRTLVELFSSASSENAGLGRDSFRRRFAKADAGRDWFCREVGDIYLGGIEPAGRCRKAIQASETILKKPGTFDSPVHPTTSEPGRNFAVFCCCAAHRRGKESRNGQQCDNQTQSNPFQKNPNPQPEGTTP